MRSTWNEDLYTTKLDKSKSRITVEEANRLAAEIEAAARAGRTSNHHLVEERGMAVDGADEARWHQTSGVRVWVRDRGGRARRAHQQPPPGGGARHGGGRRRRGELAPWGPC